MDHMHIDIHPGPLVDGLLTLQSSHRSSLVWSGDQRTCEVPLVFRRFDSTFWKHTPLSGRVLELVDRAGFGGIRRVGHIQVDHALITALVERWRQETHTFHFPLGETTVTLEDVAMLWGLKIDGDPVIGPSCHQGKSDWIDLCDRLLGIRPRVEDIHGNRIRKAPIEEHLDIPLLDDASDDCILQRARCLIFILIGGLLFSDKSGTLLHLRYLPILEDLEACGKLSWGSAVLAYLYRCLCQATIGSAQEICGPMVLVQLWAWERVRVLQPERGRPRDELPPLAPYGARWNVRLHFSRTPTHVLVSYRSQLDALSDEDFVWQPYRPDLVSLLPPIYLEGQDIWRSRTALISWEVVELYFPDRVMRQFGMVQPIPIACNTRIDLHAIDRRSNPSRDWSKHHGPHLQMWAQRLEYIQTGLMGVSVASDYMQWYRDHTRLRIENPVTRGSLSSGYQPTGSSTVVLADIVRRAMTMAVDAIPNANSTSRRVFVEIRDMCARGLTACHQAQNRYTGPLQIGSSEATAALVQPSSRPRALIERRAQSRVSCRGKRPRVRGSPVSDDRVGSPLAEVDEEMVKGTHEEVGDDTENAALRRAKKDIPLENIARVSSPH